jgi:uncharacterized protein (DUF885 family)
MTPDEIHQLGLNEVAFNCRNGKNKKQVGLKELYWSFRVCKKQTELKPFTKPEEVIANFRANLHHQT